MTTPLQEISLQVPGTFQIPELFLQGDPALTATALTLGAESCRILTKEAFTKVRNETHQEIIAEVRKKTDQEIAQIKREREETEERLEQITKKVRRLEQDQSIHEDRIRQEERRNREEIAKEKDARIQALEQQLRESSKTLTEGFQALKEQMIRNTTGSTNKGKEGEAHVEELLKLAYGSAPSFDLNPVAKEGHKGDFLMEYEGAKLLWEVKNYSRMVNKEEVEKLHRDMRENPEAAVGIMISLQTGIVGHTKAGDIDIEFIGTSTSTSGIRCIVYISNFHQRQDKVFYLQSLRPLFDLVAKQSQQSGSADAAAMAEEETENSKELDALRARSILVQNLLATHQAQIQRQFNSLTNHKKRSEQMFAELQSLVRESEGHVRELLRVIIGNGDVSLTSGALKNLSERIFKKTNATEMNEKERTFLLWLLSVTDEDEYGQITIKDLVDKARASEEAFPEKEVRGYRETLFQDVAWQKGGKLVLGLKWRDEGFNRDGR